MEQPLAAMVQGGICVPRVTKPFGRAVSLTARTGIFWCGTGKEAPAYAGDSSVISFRAKNQGAAHSDAKTVRQIDYNAGLLGPIPIELKGREVASGLVPSATIVQFLSSAAASCRSIIQFQGKLNLARRACGFADDAKAAAANDVGRQAKIHLVENVEELGAEL